MVTTSSVTTRTLDLLDDDDFALLHAIRWAAMAHGRDVVAPSVEVSRTSWRSDDGWSRYAVLVCDGGRPVAAGAVQLPEDDNLDTAWATAYTPPAEQRRGYGRAAAQVLLERMPPSRSKVMTTAWVPTAEAASHGYRRFAQSLGMRVAATETVRELALPVVLPEVVPPQGYAVETWVDGVPQEYRTGLGVLMGLVDIEAPTGDLSWEPSPVSPQRYAQDLATVAAVGGHVVESLALHGGQVVGFTRLVAQEDSRRPLDQHGTLVVAEHRGRGLGRALKVANLTRAQAELPGYRAVRTESDEANVAMHALNESLGFVPVETELVMQLVR